VLDVLIGLADAVWHSGLQVLAPRTECSPNSFRRVCRIFSHVVSRILRAVSSDSGPSTMSQSAPLIHIALDQAKAVISRLWETLNGYMAAVDGAKSAKGDHADIAISESASGSSLQPPLDAHAQFLMLNECGPSFPDRIGIVIMAFYELMRIIEIDSVTALTYTPPPPTNSEPSRINPSLSVTSETSINPASTQEPFVTPTMAPSFSSFLSMRARPFRLLIRHEPSLVSDHFLPLLDHPSLMPLLMEPIRTQPFERRREWFYQALHPTALEQELSAQSQPDQFIVNRETLFQTSCGALSSLPPKDLMNKFTIMFEGENGVSDFIGLLSTFFFHSILFSTKS
jgi:hypothetical protein